MSLTAPDEWRLYAAYHRPRWDTLLELVAVHAPRPESILDIGRSDLTRHLHERFQVPVDSLGFEEDGPIATGRNYQLDLNTVRTPDRLRRDLPQYDVVVFAEVVEHLPTSPRLVLDYLRTLLKPTGVMILQTPNAVALANRLQMLLGRNPYELILETDNPGHFREYTAAELRSYAAQSGLDVVSLTYGSYFDMRYAHHTAGVRERPVYGKIRNFINRKAPSSLRPGITMVMKPREGR